MRILAPAFLLALGIGAFTLACSSSDDATPSKCDGGACAEAASAVDGGGTAVIEVDAGPSDFQGGGGDGGTSGGGFDAGDPLQGSDAGTLCETTSATEQEDNSVLQAAQRINGASGSVCGRLDTFADNDFYRFTLPQQAQSLFIHIIASAGGMDVSLTADGNPVPFPSQTPGDLTFLPGKDYVIALSAPRGTPPIDYRIELTIH